jgi:hypothetical protein
MAGERRGNRAVSPKPVLGAQRACAPSGETLRAIRFEAGGVAAFICGAA